MNPSRAVRWQQNREVSVTSATTTPRTLREGEVLIAPAFNGICGTDISEWSKGPRIGKTGVAIGHEFSAVVKEVHSSVISLKVGSRVAVNPVIGCEKCSVCQSGRPNTCPNQSLLGYDLDGGTATLLIVEAKRCVPIPDSISLEVAALVEPLSVAWHGMVRSGIKKGQSAVVIGTGPIGIAAVMCLKAQGINKIMVVGRSKGKNERVLQLGVKDVFSSSEVDVRKKAKELFPDGLDVVFDAACAQSTFDLGLDIVAVGGVYYMYGIFPEEVTFKPMKVSGKAVTVTGDTGYAPGVFEAVIEAISSGAMDMGILKSWITATIPLEETQMQGFEELEKNKDKHMKILIQIQ